MSDTNDFGSTMQALPPKVFFHVLFAMEAKATSTVRWYCPRSVAVIDPCYPRLVLKYVESGSDVTVER